MSSQSPYCRSLLLLLLLLIPVQLFPTSVADVGTAAQYGPPYLPTACFGGDQGQFPAGNQFAAVGEGIWDNGAACGREYLVRCLSSATPGACVMDQAIRVTIVDLAATMRSKPSQRGTTMVLSTAAFRMIAAPTAPVINIEFTQS